MAFHEENSIQNKAPAENVRRIHVLDREIRIHICDTGNGIHVLIEGGDQGHIGAVAVAAPSFEIQVITFEGHREDVICRKWAETFAEVSHGPVVIEAGVHYDGIDRNGIMEVMNALENERKEILKELF